MLGLCEAVNGLLKKKRTLVVMGCMSKNFDYIKSRCLNQL